MIKVIIPVVIADIILANFYGKMFMPDTAGMTVDQVDVAYWHAYAESLLIRISIAYGLIVYLMPYAKELQSDIKAKIVMFAYFLSQVVDVFQYFVPEHSLPITLAIQTGVTCSYVLYALMRHYNQDDDVLTDRYVYTIAKRPDSIGGLLGSLFGEPYGNYSHYIRGTVYYFHKDDFHSMPIEKYDMTGKTIIKSDVEVTDRVINKANSMLKSRWSLWKFNNCMTVLMRLRRV